MMKTSLTVWQRLLPIVLFCKGVYGGFSQSEEGPYLNNFGAIQAATYAVADADLPAELDVCKSTRATPTREVSVQSSGSIVGSSTLFQQCGADSICVLPLGLTLRVDSSLNLGALVVRGHVEWTDESQRGPIAYICAGYIAVEGQGQWNMNVQKKDVYLYIKNNGAVHEHLRTRAFGTFAATASDYPTIDIEGRELTRTWSLLASPFNQGANEIRLMHDAELMGWRVGDRVGIAPSEERAKGSGEEFLIVDIAGGTLLLDKTSEYFHDATFQPPLRGNTPALMSAEVVNLSRNIVITGDEFRNIPCDPNLPESVPGEETSTVGCRCSSFRTQCTVGLHTMVSGGAARIQNTRLERCGQRGIEGKYCLHFHKLGDCPTCLFKNNAIEGSHQRGIIVHGTHSSTVESNTLWNVRGAGIYIEDGNEMRNDIKYNVVVCPFPFNHPSYQGCTIPGTSNRIADTSDNQAGIFTRAATNSLIGNRVSNNFNGMLLKAGSIGRGDSYGKVCESDAKLARIEGNTFALNGRFGTYTLGSNYPKVTDQSIQTNGHNINQSLCSGFDDEGRECGVSASIVDNLDYGNAFVGHYEAGDIQYNGHMSFNNNNLMYWKETKNFANGCSAHITGGSYAQGTMALPDQATFLIEDTTFGEGVSLEANHHCNAGTTGVLCFPTYMLHNVQFKNSQDNKWVWFQWQQLQSHNANQNYGGIFTLSPPDAKAVMDGGVLENSIFPPGFVSLVSDKYSFLLNLPGNPCTLSTAMHGFRYDGGILCTVPLRSLKIYTKDMVSGSAPGLRVQIWYDRNQVGNPDSSHIVPFHQIGGDFKSRKQGYSLPVVPGANHSYRLSLTVGNGDLPSSWVVEFSDLIVGNRFSVEYINLHLNGRSCGQGGLVSSHHDRSFIWSGDEFMADEAWGSSGACAAERTEDSPLVDCSLIDDGIIPAGAKAGFTDDIEDLCGAARCGERGTCSAKYLGGTMPVTANACICDEGWSGPLCQFNPCETNDKTCSGHGQCVAGSDTAAVCRCDQGFSGEDCELTCEGECSGEFPYSCATDSPGAVKYGCHPQGGCSYLQKGQEFPYKGFCVYKEEAGQVCLCGSSNECQYTVSCNEDGSCPPPQNLLDGSPCNSVPFGECQSGLCLKNASPSPPMRKPTLSPSIRPSTQPNEGSIYCGCDSCDHNIWNAPATDEGGTYSCGARITWLQNEGGYTKEDACMRVSEEFENGPCGLCHPSKCGITLSPTTRPMTSDPTKEPTNIPTFSEPSQRPVTQTPTISPISGGHCGCRTCTQTVWDTPSTDKAGTHTLGSRIEWLQNEEGYDESGACAKVSVEFPDLCPCDSTICDKTPAPSPSPSATPTLKPQVTFCGGCSTCTESVWDSLASDGSGEYSCGARVNWLINTQNQSEYQACEEVTAEFPTICTCDCSRESLVTGIFH